MEKKQFSTNDSFVKIVYSDSVMKTQMRASNGYYKECWTVYWKNGIFTVPEASKPGTGTVKEKKMVPELQPFKYLEPVPKSEP